MPDDAVFPDTEWFRRESVKVERQLSIEKTAEIARLKSINEKLLKACQDLLLTLDKPSQEVSPSWIIGACRQAREAIAEATSAPPVSSRS